MTKREFVQHYLMVTDDQVAVAIRRADAARIWKKVYDAGYEAGLAAREVGK